jgi:4'-phosphopantetheinyl transferase
MRGEMSFQQVWQEASVDPIVLGSGEVHIWIRTNTLTMKEEAEFVKILSEDEIRRADRYRTQDSRKQFICSRLALRNILSQYLGEKPDTIRFDYSKFGKPHLSPSNRGQSIQFNLSHAYQYTVLAFSQGMKIGIDIEYLNQDIHPHEMTAFFCSPDEIKLLRSIDLKEKLTEAFFRIWTFKESLAKACGEGFSLPLHQITVVTPDLHPVEEVQIIDSSGVKAPWHLFSLPAPGPYLAAITADHLPEKVRLFCY